MAPPKNGLQVQRGGLVEQNHRQRQLRKDRERLSVGPGPDQSQARRTKNYPDDDEYQRGRQVPASDQPGDGGVAEHEDCEDERGLTVHSLLLPQRRLHTDIPRYAPGVLVSRVASICSFLDVRCSPPSGEMSTPAGGFVRHRMPQPVTGLEFCRHPLPSHGIGARRRCPHDLLLRFLPNCYSPQCLILLCLAKWYR